MLNSSHQFRIPEHMLNRNRSTQDITEVYDVTSKESLNNVKIRLSEINKHISDGVDKLPVENKCNLKTKEAKNFSKSEVELVDVMSTLQRAISIIEKEMTKNPTFLQKETEKRNMNFVMAALIMMKTSMSIAVSKKCQ